MISNKSSITPPTDIPSSASPSLVNDTAWIGEEAELRFQIECLRRRWECAKPLHPLHPYDLLIRRPGSPWETVQVKACGFARSGLRYPRLVVNLRHGYHGHKRRYQASDFDILAAVDVINNRIWLIPFEALRYQRSNFSLRAADVFLLTDLEPDLTDQEPLIQRMRDKHLWHFRRKLSRTEVLQLRQEYMNGMNQRELAARYGIALSSVGRILREESYGNGESVVGLAATVQHRRTIPHNRKLTMGQAEEIRQKHAAGQSKGSLAREYGIERTTVRQLLNGITYQHGA